METVRYESNCELCDMHKTDLGVIKGIEETVKTNFPDWSVDRQADLVVNWFEKTWKIEIGNRIQKDKQANMKEMRK